MSTDYVGNEIEVGDEVIFVQKGYRNFWRGVIKRITTFTVLISHERTNTGGVETRQDHSQVIKVIK